MKGEALWKKWARERQPWDNPVPSTTGLRGEKGPRQVLEDVAGTGLWRLQHPLLCACAPLCAARIASIVVVPIVWRPLALVLIVLAPLLGILRGEQEYWVISLHSRLCLLSFCGPPSTHGPFDRDHSALER